MQPQPYETNDGSARTWNKPLAWVSGILAVIGLIASGVLSMGIAVIFWGPAVILFAVAMWGVWGARRRRQLYENRAPDETRDPLHAPREWPREGVIDDRLPQN